MARRNPDRDGGRSDGAQHGRRAQAEAGAVRNESDWARETERL